MIEHIVSGPIFGYFKHRFLTIRKTGYEGLDERIIPSLEKMSKWKDIASVWSCSGHTPEETKEGKTFKNRQSRYIIFVCNDPLTLVLDYINDYLNNLSYKDWLLTRPKLQAFQLHTDVLTTPCRYNCWKLEFEYLYNSKHPENDVRRRERISEIWEELFDFVNTKLNPVPYTLEERLQLLKDKFGGDNEFINRWSQVPEGQDPKETHHVLDRQGIPRFKEI